MMVRSSNLVLICRESLFQRYQQHPVNAFKRPIFYRAVHRGSPSEVHGSLRARLFPPPSLETLTARELQTHVANHAIWGNGIPTPFISLTDDILRALSIVFCVYHDKEDVEMLLFDAWKLAPGSFLKCNELRSRIGIGGEDIYNTELLVWGEVPADSIIYRWERSQILSSGIVDVLPSLCRLSAKTTLETLRYGLRGDYDSFSPRKAAIALASLGMDPSSLQTKQVFLFLLGSVAGYRVEKRLGDVASTLETEFPLKIQEFDQTVHQQALTLGRGKLVSYYRNDYAADVKDYYLHRDNRRWRKIWSLQINNWFCPDFEDWWVQREESNFSDYEVELAAGHDENGLNGWSMKRESRSYYIGFSD